MRKYILGVVLLLFMTLVIPSIIDTPCPKYPVITLFKNITGYAVDINGPVYIKFFPTLRITAHNMVFQKTAPPPHNATFLSPLMTAKAIFVDVAFFSLLRGEVCVHTIDILAPKLHLILPPKDQKHCQENYQENKQSHGINHLHNEVHHDLITPPPIGYNGVPLQHIHITDGLICAINHENNKSKKIKNITFHGDFDPFTGRLLMYGGCDMGAYALAYTLQGDHVTNGHSSPLTATISVSRSFEKCGSLVAKGTLQGFHFLGRMTSKNMRFPFTYAIFGEKIDLQKGLQIEAGLDVNLEDNHHNIKVSSFQGKVDGLTLKGNISYTSTYMHAEALCTVRDTELGMTLYGKKTNKGTHDHLSAVEWDMWLELYTQNPHVLRDAMAIVTYLSPPSSSLKSPPKHLNDIKPFLVIKDDGYKHALHFFTFNPKRMTLEHSTLFQKDTDP